MKRKFNVNRLLFSSLVTDSTTVIVLDQYDNVLNSGRWSDANILVYCPRSVKEFKYNPAFDTIEIWLTEDN